MLKLRLATRACARRVAMVLSTMADVPMTYARYLALDELLACQHPISDRDDEMLFVVMHQTK